MDAHLISILVRTKNDEAFIERTLKALLSQRCAFPFEIIVCDDASDDNTPRIIASVPQIASVPRPEGAYMPGRTLNHLARHANGDLLVFNNADAIPQNDNYLQEILKPLLETDAEAVYANQLPRPDADWLVRKDNIRAFGDGKIASQWRFFFSMAASAARKTTIMEHPFNETIRYSEDVEWAYSNRLRIAYAKDALVEHSHNYTFAQLKKRFHGEGYADARIFGTVPSLFRSMLSAGMETLRDWAFLIRNPSGLRELPTAPVRRWLQKMSYRKGAIDYVRSLHSKG
ncbi:MAG: glycosyltransferase family 2 protein [Victivallales bacterium]|nr:glycosyltransferase family 2 protein [Victivallales bacterium]